MPSTANLFAGLGVTAVILTAGGWLASHAHATEIAGETTMPTAARSSAADTALIVDLNPVISSEGRVIVMVFDDADAYGAFDYQRAADFAERRAEPGEMRFVFDDLIAGPYAVFAFHDADGDYDLTMDGAVPLEGFGGTGMVDWRHEPSFAEAQIAAGETRITLHYLD